MKTVCLLNNKVIMSQDGEAVEAMTLNAFQYEGATVEIITDEEFEKKKTPLTYEQKRQAEYPPMTDYLDAIVKGDTAQQQAYIDACLAVKAKYPKGTK